MSCSVWKPIEIFDDQGKKIEVLDSAQLAERLEVPESWVRSRTQSRNTIVSLTHTQQAAAWCEYLESHARRIYAMIISPERQAAAEQGRHLAEGWKQDEGIFTVRDVYRNQWTGLDTPDRVRAALDILCDASWVRPMEIGEHRTGRPSEIYASNPHLRGKRQ